MQNKSKLLILDWDGTVADSHPRIIAAMQAAIVRLALPDKTPEQIEAIIGTGLIEATASLFPTESTQMHHRLADVYRQLYVEIHDGPNPLFPKAIETLTCLNETGYTLAIATAKSRQGLNRDLYGWKLTALFAATRCAEDTESKPSPQMILELMAELDIDPESTVMIGDSEYDMQMAQNAGVTSILADYGDQKRMHLLDYNPIACLNRFCDLPEVLYTLTNN